MYLNDKNKDEKYLDRVFIGVSNQLRNGKIWSKELHLLQSKERLKYYLERYFENNWRKYVNNNYFQGLVDKDLKPKLLWKNHTFDNVNYPDLGEKLYNMLCEINRSIVLRNRRIDLETNI